MDLKDKLARLGPSPVGAREDTLSALRAQMAEVLGRERPAPPRRRKAEIRLLPFVLEETDTGPIHRRVVRYTASHHIGRFPLDAARVAGAEVLSLLALEPSFASLDFGKALFLDTETTGLGGGTGTLAFLVGLAFFEGESLVVEQLLLRSPDEERALLDVVAARLRSASVLVTFNGKTFDAPLLSARFVMNRLPELPDLPHLDLLHVARRLHKARLGSCTLKALEAEVLGFVRDADIDGGDVAPRYVHFLRTGDETSLQTVVDHNEWDVASMAALVGLYGEPLDVLHRDDLVGLARTFRRARAFEAAERAADRALEGGSSTEALRVRAEIAKARGDRARALSDFETLVESVDDPRARLELAKLYEHFAREPERAMDMVDRGTSEAPDAAARRRTRLAAKAKAKRGGAGGGNPGGGGREGI